MGRHLEFNIIEAKKAAVELFWSKGYHAATLDLLCEHMGIAKSSFYSTLGDKRTLFIACIDVYLEIILNEFTKLSSVDELKQNISRRFVEPRSPQAHIGCMLVNTATEMADVDDKLVQLMHNGVQQATQHRVDFFARMGCPQSQAVRLGRFYQVFMEGLCMSSRRKVPKQQLKAVIETAFEFIEADIKIRQNSYA